jgi:hypothetical protein
MTSRKPSARPVCPLCAGDDDLAENASPSPGRRQFTCAAHKAPYTFTINMYKEFPGGEGLYAQYGIDDTLVSCVNGGYGHHSGDGYIEHAVVEYRLSIENPDGYRACLEAWGHTTIKAKHYTATVYLGLRLGALSRQGAVLHRPGPGTGHFHYNSELGYWASATAAADAGSLSWADFAKRERLDASFPYARVALGLPPAAYS